MKGWKIQPLGWLLLAVLVGLVIYFVIWRLRGVPRNKTDHGTLEH